MANTGYQWWALCVYAQLDLFSYHIFTNQKHIPHFSSNDFDVMHTTRIFKKQQEQSGKPYKRSWKLALKLTHTVEISNEPKKKKKKIDPKIKIMPQGVWIMMKHINLFSRIKFRFVLIYWIHGMYDLWKCLKNESHRKGTNM